MENFHPVIQALIAGIFTWGITAIGSSFVFFSKRPSQKLRACMLGFAAGVMLAASFWSLLVPSIELSAGKELPVWFPTTTGFLLGCFLIGLIDKILPHLHLGLLIESAEGIKTKLHKTTLLVLAITLHNIPEGLAVGVAFGAITYGVNEYSFASALALSIGIGIQNFPEGIAVAMPIRAEGLSRFKSFWFGQLSAITEPIAAIIGAAAVMIFQPLLPYALAFAAGAMIFVVVEEVIPESQQGNNSDLATISTIIGFVFMMILDVSLG